MTTTDFKNSEILSLDQARHCQYLRSVFVQKNSIDCAVLQLQCQKGGPKSSADSLVKNRPCFKILIAERTGCFNASLSAIFDRAVLPLSGMYLSPALMGRTVDERYQTII